MRNDQPTLRKGYYLPVETANASVLSYARVFGEESAIIVSNFENNPVSNPALSLAASTLPAGTYPITELYSRRPMGSVTINEEGGTSNWILSGNTIGAGETWVLLLSQTYVQPTGLPAEHEALGLQLYPNPSTGKVTIQLGEGHSPKSQLKVYSLAGKLMFATDFIGDQHILDTKHWTNGTYILKIQSGNAMSVKRLAVMH